MRADNTSRDWLEMGLTVICVSLSTGSLGDIIFIWGSKLSDIRSEILFYGDARAER